MLRLVYINANGNKERGTLIGKYNNGYLVNPMGKKYKIFVPKSKVLERINLNKDGRRVG